MDLEQQATIHTKSTSGAEQPTEVTLFDAVREWTDTEGVDAFEIELDGKRLSSEQIQAITHSEVYKDRLLAFNERIG